MCSKMPAGSRKDVLPAHTRIQWRQAGQSEAGCMRRGGVFSLACSEWGPLGQRAGQCLCYERSRPCQSNHSRESFLSGYNKISFSIHILVVGFVRVCLCERERGDGSQGCLIGKQMNNVSLGWRRKGDRNKCCVYRRERVILVVWVICRDI